LKKTIIVFLIITLFTFALSIFLYIDLLFYAKNPSEKGDIKQIIDVYPGQKFEVITDNLRKKAIIGNPFKFKLLALINGYDKKIKAGEYLFSASMPPEKILQIMTAGKVRLHRLTIPEGYNLNQIAEAVENAELCSKAAFLEAATDPLLAHEKGIENKTYANTFEGYLFPDTYYFPKGITPNAIISKMLSRFWSAFKPEWKKEAKKMRLSVHQIVTLASIIEKETGASFERPIISSVFHNRLRRGIRLESDPTVIYGIKDFDGNITKKHLQTPTPYNTYKKKGLPPGPIANPGTDSLKAAIYPDDTDFLYFVSKGDNTHKFSKNIKEHKKAVRRYIFRQTR